MPTSTLTPNMSLIVPVAGAEQGPQYAIDINTSLAIIDQHDHTPGNGVAISPAGMNINEDLSFINNNATNLRSARFQSQSASLSLPNDLDCLYVVGVDLYYNDGNGNVIRFTQGGSIAGASGTITGLVSPASVVFNSLSGKYTFQSNTNTAGSIDVGSVTIREPAANTQGITIASPTSLAASYSLTLPTGLPGSTSFMAMDMSGNISASIPISKGLTASNISDSANITGIQLSASANILGTQIASSPALQGHPTITNGSGTFGLGATSENNVILLRGVIDATGSIISGSGFTVAHTGSSGVYTITFVLGYDDVPGVSLGVFHNPMGFDNNTINFTAMSASAFTVRIYDTVSDAPDDAQWSFIVMGIRTP